MPIINALQATASANPLKALTPRSDNGILSYISGDTIGGSSKTLPSPCAAEMHTPLREVEVEVSIRGGIGIASITYQLKEYRHHKSHWYGWTAIRADAV